MKKIGLIVTFLLFCAATSQAQSCDCTITPFNPNPPCFNSCTVNLLATSSMEELIYVLKVSPESAARIVSWPKRERARSLGEFIEVLSSPEIMDVAARANSLSQRQLTLLNRDRRVSQGNILRNEDNPDANTAGVNITTMQGSATMGGAIGSLSGTTGAVGSVVGSTPSPSPSPTSGKASSSRRKITASTRSERPTHGLTYDYFKDRKGKWHWQMKDYDGRIIAQSAVGYASEIHCLAAIEIVKGSSDAAVVRR